MLILFLINLTFSSSSQIWKVFRIGAQGNREADPLLDEPGSINAEKASIKFSPRNFFTDSDNLSSLGVELSACLGGWFLFGGTIIYHLRPDWLLVSLIIWELGSIFFTMGSVFLATRHFILYL